MGAFGPPSLAGLGLVLAGIVTADTASGQEVSQTSTAAESPAEPPVGGARPPTDTGPAPAVEASTPEKALAIAEAAFEYRDFEQVVAALDPWVHPPRIVDPSLMVRARRLLGVSLHVLGRVRDAREEFAQLLLIDPKHELDPFTIPPQVIATFEDVRNQLEVRERPPPPESPLNGPAPPPRIVGFLPFGLNHFAMDDVGHGAIWGSLQVAGLVLNIVAFDQAEGVNSETGQSQLDQWTAVQFGGLGLMGVAYLISILQGNLALDEMERQSRQQSPQVGLRF